MAITIVRSTPAKHYNFLMANWFLNFFPDRVLLLAQASSNSLCTQGCLWTPYPPPVSISQILRLQVWTNTPGFVWSWGSTPELHALQASTLATKLSFPTKKILSYGIHTLTYTHAYVHTYTDRHKHTHRVKVTIYPHQMHRSLACTFIVPRTTAPVHLLTFSLAQTETLYQ